MKINTVVELTRRIDAIDASLRREEEGYLQEFIKEYPNDLWTAISLAHWYAYSDGNGNPSETLEERDSLIGELKKAFIDYLPEELHHSFNWLT